MKLSVCTTIATFVLSVENARINFAGNIFKKDTYCYNSFKLCVDFIDQKWSKNKVNTTIHEMWWQTEISMEMLCYVTYYRTL